MLFPQSPEILVNCPISMSRLELIIDLLNLPPKALVFDAGCGRGELLIRIAEKYGACGKGVDLDKELIGTAVQMTEMRLRADDVQFLCCDVEEVTHPANSLDLAICRGSSHIYGGYEKALQTLHWLLKPHGMLLIGEPFWENIPNEEYLNLFGMQKDSYSDHATNVMRGIEHSFTPLYTASFNQDEWDYFESILSWQIESKAYEPDNDLAAMPFT